MTRVTVRRWAAWAPGIESLLDWTRWCEAPAALVGDGSPEIPFVPPLLRRRCSRLARLMLHVAHAASDPAAPGVHPTVFASRYGEIASTIALLERAARHETLTAAAFTHSVHNAAAALFSIVTKNRSIVSAIAAGPETFAMAFVEALAVIARDEGRPTLLVMADEPLPKVFERFRDAPRAAYAAAFLIEGNGPGPHIEMDAGTPGSGPSDPPWPHAIEFLRWLMSGEPHLTLGRGSRSWRWTRA